MCNATLVTINKNRWRESKMGKFSKMRKIQSEKIVEHAWGPTKLPNRQWAGYQIVVLTHCKGVLDAPLGVEGSEVSISSFNQIQHTVMFIKGPP